MGLSYVKISYKNDYKPSGTRPIEKQPFQLKVVELEIEKEDELKYHLVDGPTGPLPRSNVVYKNDEEDVFSCGYVVIDTPVFYDVGLFEGFAYVYTFDKEKGIEMLRKGYEERIQYFIDSYTALLEVLNKDNKEV